MSTESNLPIVRYFTPLDVYHYLVDNRPLRDLRSNVARVANAVDSEVAAKSITNIALGFLGRALATENTAIGVVSYNGLDFTIQRAVMTQSLAASGTDSRLVPFVGIATDAETFSLTLPSTADTVRPYIIQARLVSADATTPLYNTGLVDMAAFTNVKNIEWQLVQGADQSSNDPVSYPSPDVGWVSCFRIRMYDSSIDVNPYQVTYTNFKDEGNFGGSGSGAQFELHKFTHTMASASDTVTGITVNANFGMVFVDGLLQPDVTVLSPSSIQFPSALAVGQVVDVMVTAGGSANLADSVHSRFEFTAVADGQTVFSNPDMDFSTDQTFLFVNDKFIPWTDYAFSSGGTVLTLNTGVQTGDKVFVFEMRSVSSGLPHIPGGTGGDSLVKTGPGPTDYGWGGGGIGVGGGVVGDTISKTGPLATDVEWLGYGAHGTVRLEYVSIGHTVKLVRAGGGGIIIDGARRVIPTGGVTCAEFTDAGWLSTAVASGFQGATVWLGLSYNTGTSTFTLSPYLCSTNHLEWTTSGIPVLQTNNAVTIVGAAQLVYGADRVLPLQDARNALVRSLFGERSVSAVYSNSGAVATASLWSQIGPSPVTEPSGVAWHQAPLSTLQQVVIGSDTVYSHVRGLVLPGETYQIGLQGSYQAAGGALDSVVVRLCPLGLRYVTDASGGASYQPRLSAPATSIGQVSITSMAKYSDTAPVPKSVFVLPEVDLRAGTSFKAGYYQTTFGVIK